MKRFLLGVIVVALVLVGGFLVADYSYPLPGFSRAQTTLVVTQDGTPMGVVGTSGGSWSYPVRLSQVSRWYRQALVAVRDPGFFHHPGIAPTRLVRAAWRRVTGRGKPVKASLTMRVAQLMIRYPRSLWGDLRTLFRTAQLELHYSKQDILALYLNHAPFGGPLHGVQAASYAYFHKPAADLDQAEAALLVALPSAPSRLRPDRHPQAAKQARAQVLSTLRQSGVWTRYAVRRASRQAVPTRMSAHPQLAPLLARRLVRRDSSPRRLIHTTLDAGLQRNLRLLAKQTVTGLPPATNAAILVVDNRNMAVRAYVGSGAYAQRERFGYVDMVTPQRRVGSALDPFVYGFALDAGLIDSASLLADVPRAFGDYIPNASDARYRGPVSAEQALQQNLTIPATQLLAHFGSKRMLARLRRAGIKIKLLGRKTPKLDLISQGMGASLEQLVYAYSALGRDGAAGQPRLQPDADAGRHRLLSAGAAWIVRRILATRPTPQGLTRLPQGHRLAWASGASSGGRDRWAVGVSGNYTVGVWLGRPDGSRLPGYYNKPYSAVPLLFDAAGALPQLGGWQARAQKPDKVARTTICWPLGAAPRYQHDPRCRRRIKAWTIDGKTPPTLTIKGARWQAGIRHFQVNADTGKRVTRACPIARRHQRSLVQWPISVEPWLAARQRLQQRLPPWDSSCPAKLRKSSIGLQITGTPPGGVLKAPSGQSAAYISLATDNEDSVVFWLVNRRLRRATGPFENFSYRITQSGRYQILAIDAHGRYTRITVKAELNSGS